MTTLTVQIRIIHSLFLLHTRIILIVATTIILPQRENISVNRMMKTKKSKKLRSLLVLVLVVEQVVTVELVTSVMMEKEKSVIHVEQKILLIGVMDGMVFVSVMLVELDIKREK